MTATEPRVRVVVLNFDGGQMTIDCIESLLATDWPASKLEVVLVDNGSLDDVVERVKRDHPSVRVLEPLANLGFAGGCNLGIVAPPVADFEPEFVALVNNDATVTPGWLRALHAAVSSAPDLGAACAKMLFADPMTGFEFSVDTPTCVDGRCFAITGMRVNGKRFDARFSFDEGVFGPIGFDERAGEELKRWASIRRSVRLTASGEAVESIALRLHSEGPVNVVFRSDEGEQNVAVTSTPQWFALRPSTAVFDVVNNVGSNLYAGGFGGDRGFLERDRGQYEEPAEVFAWCGGAVLLKRDYLDSVGLFDERLFLYYEDTDLSWRGRLAGWRYVYEPSAIVRHRHAQSSGVGTPLFRYQTERNRLLVLAKCAPARVAWRAGLGELRRLVARHLRDLVIRPLTLKMPIRSEVRHRRRVFFSYLSLLPGVLRDRWLLDRRVSRRSIMVWQVTK